MSDTKPIYLIAKNLGVESSGIISACQSLGISAKASSKRLDKKDQDKIINYFKTGKNVAQETIDLNKPVNLSKNELRSQFRKRKDSEINFFPNRLISKY